MPLATKPGLQALCEDVLAAPGSEARSDLTHTSMQYLATEPGLQTLCEHALAAPGSKARSDLTHASMQYLASEPGLQALCEQTEGCKLCVNMYKQHLALRPGLT